MNVEVATDARTLREVVAACRKAGRVAVVTVADGDDPMSARLVGIGLSCRESEGHLRSPGTRRARRQGAGFNRGGPGGGRATPGRSGSRQGRSQLQARRPRVATIRLPVEGRATGRGGGGVPGRFQPFRVRPCRISPASSFPRDAGVPFARRQGRLASPVERSGHRPGTTAAAVERRGDAAPVGSPAREIAEKGLTDLYRTIDGPLLPLAGGDGVPRHPAGQLAAGRHVARRQ